MKSGFIAGKVELTASKKVIADATEFLVFFGDKEKQKVFRNTLREEEKKHNKQETNKDNHFNLIMFSIRA